MNILIFDPTLKGEDLLTRTGELMMTTIWSHYQMEKARYNLQKDQYHHGRVAETGTLISYIPEIFEEIIGNVICEAGSYSDITRTLEAHNPSWFLDLVYRCFKRFMDYERDRWGTIQMKMAPGCLDVVNELGGLILGTLYSWLIQAQMIEKGIEIDQHVISESEFYELIERE